MMFRSLLLTLATSAVARAETKFTIVLVFINDVGNIDMLPTFAKLAPATLKRSLR